MPSFAVSAFNLSSRVFGIAEDPATGLVYVGEYGPTNGSGPVTGTVVILDGVTGATEATVQVPGVPQQLQVDPATNTVYASSTSGLTVINGATDEAVTTLSAEYLAAPDPATGTVYASTTLAGSAAVAVIDATNTVTSVIPLTGVTGSLESLAVDASTDTVYAGTRDGRVFAIDGATDAVTGSVQLSQPVSSFDPVYSLAVDSASDTVYAVNGDTVYAVDETTLTVTSPITGCASQPLAAAVDTAADAVLVTSYGTVYPNPADATCVISTATNSVVGTFPRGGTAIAVDPATGTAYIAAWNPLSDVWVATPSTTSELSPMDFGFNGAGGSSLAVFAVGIPVSRYLLLSATPAATVTETGALPAGVTMSPAGVFSGTPATGTVGTYPITVQASNGVAPDDTVSLTIDVDIAPEITSPATATMQTGVAGSFTVHASGDPAPTVSADDYPSWLTFTSGASSGVFTGTPPAGSGGVYEIYVWAANSYGQTPSQELTLTVNQPPSFRSAAEATFQTGRSSTYSVLTSGYPSPTVTTAGPLPAGVHLSSGGTLSGTPTKGGVYKFTITASNGVGAPATQAFTLTVDQAPKFTSAKSVTFSAGRRHTFTIRTTGYPKVTLSESGKLPRGVTFKAGSNGTAVLTGVPVRADKGKKYVITITARNGVGKAVRQTFTLRIS